VGRNASEAGRPTVSAVVLNYANWDTTVLCVRDLLAQDYPALEIVIVDNCSPDNSAAALQQVFLEEPRVAVISSERNAGYAAGNNCGVRWRMRRGPLDYALIVNNDTRIPSPDVVSRLIDVAGSEFSPAIVGPRVISPGGFLQGPYGKPRLPICCLRYCVPCLPYLYRLWQRVTASRARLRPCYAVVGAFFLVDAQCFVEAGMFDESTFLGAEEYILSERVRRRGRTIYHCPSVTIIHNHEAGSVARTGGSVAYFGMGLDSMSYYFRSYRDASELGIEAFRACAKLYERIFLPMRKHLLS
jgi:GT2 family glycosyltransferase